MGEFSIFDMISPTDYRYYVKELEPFLSEESFVAYKSRVEAVLAKVLADKGVISRKSAEDIETASKQVTAKEVYDEEENTRHDIIAQVNMIRKRLGDEAATCVHRAATSYDIVDTANAMRYRDAFNDVIIPDMIALELQWCDMTEAYSGMLQIGRTHLQHAEPITFGFTTAWYLSRFGNRIAKINDAANNLIGKFSGAVGAYNASSLFVNEPENFEKDFLAAVGLKPGDMSTQIVQPEPSDDLLHYVVSAFGILANWADDMRNLQRPEIGEVGQPRGADISRSSTMPHKANPVGIENVKSIWKITMPFMVTMYLDQISDHQRDLTNSASQRYIPVIFDHFDYAVKRALRVSKNLKPHEGNMLRNFNISADKIIAEPLQLVLASYGHPDAHAYVGKLADESYKSGRPLTEIAMNDPSLQPYLAKFTPSQREILADPKKYIGLAAEKATEVATGWRNKIGAWRGLASLGR